MTKSSALIGVRNPKKPSASLAHRAQAVLVDVGSPALKPLLIGMGVGAALVGTAFAVRSKHSPLGRSFTANPELGSALTRTALIALARMVSGQTARSVASSALLEVARVLKQ